MIMMMMMKCLLVMHCFLNKRIHFFFSVYTEGDESFLILARQLSVGLV